MNFSTCMLMTKKVLLFIALISPVTFSYAEDTPDIKPAVEQPIVSDTNPEDKLKEQLSKLENKEKLTPEEEAALKEELLAILDEQYLPEFPKAVRAQLHILYSKIESIRLMLSNNALNLTLAQKNAFLKEVENIRSEIQSNASIFEGTTRPDILVALEFNQQLLQSLLFNIRKGLKTIKPFRFIPGTRAAPQQKVLIMQEIEKVNNSIMHLENEFKDFGSSFKDKMMRRWVDFNRSWSISRRTILTTTTAFAACLAIYLLGSRPNPYHWLEAQKRIAQQTHTADREKTLNDINDEDVDAIYAQMDIDENAKPQKDTWWDNIKQGIRNTRITNWIDRKFIGTKPKSFSRIISVTEMEPDMHPGTGLFGTVHTHAAPFAALIGFMAIAKKFVDSCIDDFNTWKSLGKDPKGFFKFKELFHNEKQAVSPLEELFLMHAIEPVEPKISFDDIAGLYEQKQALMPIIKYLLNPDLFEKTGTSIERGYLFYGPTRTGKTWLAEALAGELILKYKKPLSFFKIRGSELRGGLFGGSIKKVLEIIQKYAPCIVFIDEIDLLNLQRDQNSAMLEEFLTCWKTNDVSHRDIIVLAATNRIDHIDHALLQPGRFGKTITFENPTLDDRREFFYINLIKKNIIDPRSVDLERLALETEGCTFGDLASIVNAALTQATQSRQRITYHHFDAALDAYKRKIVPSELSLPEEERKVMAVHLAGHALAYFELPTGEQLHKVTMMPIQKKVHEEKIWLSELTVAKKITSYGDVFTLHKRNTSGFDTPTQKMNKAKAQLAGHAAERVLLGACAYNYHADMDDARRTIEDLVFKGLKKEHFSRDGADQKLNEITTLLQKYEEEMIEFMTVRKDKLEKLTNALNQRLTLSLEEIQELLKN